jgi:hypothetical protein
VVVVVVEAAAGNAIPRPALHLLQLPSKMPPSVWTGSKRFNIQITSIWLLFLLLITSGFCSSCYFRRAEVIQKLQSLSIEFFTGVEIICWSLEVYISYRENDYTATEI